MTGSTHLQPTSANIDFSIQVARGLVPGFYKVNKFGEAIDCNADAATDVWDGADGSTSTDVWVPPNAARTHAIVSTSTDDDNTSGTGMRTVKVYGLTSWDTKETSEIVILDGTDAVDTANDYVIIHRMHGVTWGTGGQNAGIIKATAATDSTITAAILATQNQTQMIIYGIPSTQTLYIKSMHASLVKDTGASAKADGELLVMPNADDNAAANTAWVNKENFLFEEGLPPWSHYYDPVKTVAGPAIIKIQVTADTIASKAIASFDAYVIDNNAEILI